MYCCTVSQTKAYLASGQDSHYRCLAFHTSERPADPMLLHLWVSTLLVIVLLTICLRQAAAAANEAVDPSQVTAGLQAT